MPADNTLGAPTEGLGQTVTFAIGGGRGTPQTTGDQRGALRSSISGNGVQRTSQALQVQQAVPDPTFQALAKMGGAMLQPHIEQERQAKYIEGMQKAANQQAITEIVDEQPWYSKIFGSTSLVDGARAYTASSKASQLAAQIEEDMVNLRSKSPSEFAQHVAKLTRSANTGDQATDVMLAAQLAQTLPPVMKGQVKAHIRFKQEQLDLSRDSALTSAFTLLGSADAQTRQPDPTKEQADTLGVGLRAMELMRPLPEEDPKHFNKLLAGSAVKAILNGNFAVATLLQSTDVYKTMSAAEQGSVHEAIRKAQTDARLKLPLEFADKLETWKSLAETGASREAIMGGAGELNAEYTRITGDPSLIANASAVAGELGQQRRVQRAAVEAQLHASAQASNVLAKAEAQARAVQGVAGLMGNHDYVGNFDKDTRDAAWDYVTSTASPEQRAAIMVRQAGYNNLNGAAKDILQANVASAFLGSGNPGLLHEVYQKQYLPLVLAAGDGGEVVARQYAGDYGKVLSLYHKLARGNVLDQTTQDILYAEAARPQPKVADKATQAAIMVELVDGKFMRAIKGVFQQDHYQPVNPEGLANEIANSVDANLPLSQAVELARRNDPTLSLLGGYHWRRSSSATDVRTWLLGQKDGKVTAGEENRAVRLTIDKVAKLSGATGSVRVEQIQDVNGAPQFYTIGYGDDGVKIGKFTGADIATNWEADRKDHWYVAGPAPRQLVEDDMPGLSASQEEWAAYRKKQAARGSTTSPHSMAKPK